jgi:short-subunit dehydrogenase
VPERANILITGASSGLGAGMAREFAIRGRNLALCARRIGKLEQLRTELLRRHPGVKIAVAQLDVNNHEEVFTAFHRLSHELGGLDRVIVNAGVSQGHPIGTRRFPANLAIANTNFVAALAQSEAAMEIFRRRGAGHLVMISSIAALRGMPGLQVYSATKAGVAILAEAIRAETLATPINVTTVYPGFIESGIGGSGQKKPLMVSADKGVRAMVKAIEHETAEVRVPAWPWVPVGFALKRLPLRVIARTAVG